ncbi:Aspartate aminotransferase [Jeotgalicoccus saudimassiliensis]|uniref:Aspartate aminotransferase n=1 Tax=Jeotgalicoccus saudimassiliensis TaxID=1461582 RepID=A0A078M0A5_9STAP|nr:pyridoxal phosphate-dependent aminotransferase [Jeotgalicoccus saudimassiliensis]CEA00803.1 Aspartate aminotransferase [Jeotgalicoccus saudimassiliensis]
MTDKNSNIEELFMKLNADNAPGQESRQKNNELKLIGDKIEGEYVDFSHGDVDAHKPIPGVLDHYIDGFNTGGSQAYTEYRGQAELLKETAEKLGSFTGTHISPEDELIITPGTQGALFLALGATVTFGDKVAIVEPDYFANRKLVHFFRGEVVPVQMDYLNHDDKAGIDLSELEQAFKNGVKVFLFSNPNNPSGAIYSSEEINQIAELVSKYGVTVIADELYSRQLFDNREYTHLIAHPGVDRNKIITIIGPSKTESLSGFRLGAGFGSSEIIDRMEQLQAIVSLRASGYSQAALKSWFSEPEGWMAERIESHQAIRDDLVTLFRDAGYKVRLTEAGSYVFPQAQNLSIDDVQIAKILREQANVAVTPGTEFAPYCTDSFRLNFSQDHGKAVDAVKRIIKVLENYKNG